MTNNVSKSDICSKISDDLSAFIDGELSKEELAEVYEHLLECKDCRENYENLKLTQNAVSNYFQSSTERIETPAQSINSVLLKTAPHSQIGCSIFSFLRQENNIISKTLFSSKQRIFLCSAFILLFASVMVYLSKNMIYANQIVDESVHKVKISDNTKKDAKAEKSKNLPLSSPIVSKK